MAGNQEDSYTSHVMASANQDARIELQTIKRPDARTQGGVLAPVLLQAGVSRARVQQFLKLKIPYSL